VSGVIAWSIISNEVAVSSIGVPWPIPSSLVDSSSPRSIIELTSKSISDLTISLWVSFYCEFVNRFWNCLTDYEVLASIGLEGNLTWGSFGGEKQGFI